MKLFWVLLIAVITTNVIEAKNLIDKFLEKDIIESHASKSSNPPSYAITRRRSISLFPNKPQREKNFVVNLKPTIKTDRQTIKIKTYRKPFMKKLLIKDINNKDDVKVKVEVTTRRSLMQRMNITVRPHEVYTKSIHNKYNWNNRNISNLERSKIETNITKEKLQAEGGGRTSEEKISKEKIQNVNRDDTNDHDFNDSEKHIKNNLIEFRKSKTLLLFPKRNINYLKVNTLQIDSENKTSSKEVNDQISNVNIIGDKENITVSQERLQEVLMKSDQLEEVMEPKENLSDQEKKDEEEFIYVKEVKRNAMNEKLDDHDMTIGERFRFYSFMKNKLH